MTRGAKMLMLAGRNRSSRDGSRDGRMNYEMESNYDMDSRFRDRQGREHYNNGRYSPMRGEMQSNRWYPPYYDVEINRYEYDKPETRGGRMDGGGSDAKMRRGGSEMRMIGFERDGEMRMASDASMPRYNEMDRMPGHKAMKGGAMSHMTPKFDENMAVEWTSMMENEDGTKGPHWTMEQVKKVTEQREMDCDPMQIWVTMNMMYSDYCKVAKKLGINNMDFYVEMSKAFLEDEDAGASDKLAAYYQCVVKGQ